MHNLDCFGINLLFKDENFDIQQKCNDIKHEILRWCPSMENHCLFCGRESWQARYKPGALCSCCRRWVHKRCMNAKFKNANLKEVQFICALCRHFIDKKEPRYWMLE